MQGNRSSVWLIDSNGQIERYDVRRQQFLQLANSQGQQFKKVVSTPASLWGISCDHRLNLYVHSTHLPIREQVQTYENQRWNPLRGFCNQLLPTDRPAWSDQSGLKHLPKEGFHLPSPSWWAWERDWLISLEMPDGRPLGPDGWTYAIDFSMDKQFSPQRNMLTMVRRRLWRRTQRFVEHDRWIQLEHVNDDHLSNPIVDVAVGGEDCPANGGHHNSSSSSRSADFEQFHPDGSNAESFAVWVLTVGGQL